MLEYRVDSHLHIGDCDRVEELEQYAGLLGLCRTACLSLPVVGAEAATPGGAQPGGAPGGAGRLGRVSRLINFNPEVLLAMHRMPGVADGFGSFDNRALLAPGAGREGLEGRGRGAGGSGGSGADREGWQPAAQVRLMHEAGFRAIKMWEAKPDLQRALGITLEDPRLIEAYEEAGALGMPVLIHVADPPLFWQRPGGAWSYVGRDVPSFEELIRQAASIAERCRGTTFIFPHLLFLADDPGRMGRFLLEHPNTLLDLAPGNYLYPALGAAASLDAPADPRRREEALAFFETFQERVMAGSDSFFLPVDLALLPGTSLTNNLDRYIRLERFLGTEECFGSPYPATADEKPLIRGLGLSKRVMEKVFAGNYLRLMGTAAGSEVAAVAPDRRAALRYLESWGRGVKEAEARAGEIARRIRALRSPGPGGRGVDRAGLRGPGPGGRGVDGAGLRGAGLRGAGLRGAGVDRAGRGAGEE